MRISGRIGSGLLIALLASSGCASGAQPAPPAPEVSTIADATAEPPGESAFADSDLLPVGTSPVLGNPSAPVTIVAFASLQCPFSARASVTLRELVQHHPDEVRVVFKHYAIALHYQSGPAAQAAAAAGLQGKYWEMYDVLMANRQAFQGANMLELTAGYARELELDEDAFRQDFGREDIIEALERDAKLAASVGVRGTPTFFINGTRATGDQPLEAFEAQVREELAATERQLADGTPREQLYRARVEANLGPELEARRAAAEQRAVAERFQPTEVVPEGVLHIGASYTRGPADAPIVIYEFDSLLCQNCAEAYARTRRLEQAYPGKIRVVYKANAYQPQAVPLARAMLAAGRQQKFWQLLDRYYEAVPQQGIVDEAFVKKLAGELGLDLDKFDRDLQDSMIARQVDAELEMGKRARIRGTPSYIINGLVLPGGLPYDNYEAIIDDQLARADRLAAQMNLEGAALQAALEEANRKAAVPQ